MVKLDVSLLRFLESEDFRVLTALEMTMRNHDLAPSALIERIAQLPHGGCRKRLRNLLKHKLIFHENTSYDGYAMKYGAYDYLALRTLSKRGSCVGVGHRIGCGKESDIILVQDDNGHDCVLKLQRLGRCSFRSVSRNRDYKGHGRTRHGESWFYLSRLASQKEYAFMKLLYDEGFPVPRPIDQNRHALVMELVPGTLLNNIIELGDAEKVYRRCLELMVNLAEHGLIHGDFNEFNIMVTDKQKVIVIDFPQMVSINHRNASELFSRDVHNLANFFQRRFKVNTLLYPTLENDVTRKDDLDQRVFASGCFTCNQQTELERLMHEATLAHNNSDDGNEDSESEMDDDDNNSSNNADCQHQEHLEEKHFTKIENQSSESLDSPEQISITNVNTQSEERNATNCNNNEHDDDDDDSGNDDDDDDSNSDTEVSCQDEEHKSNSVIDTEQIKQQVRKDIRRRDNHEFNKHLHRNIQKGRQKMKINQQIKGVFRNGFFDEFTQL